MKISEVMRTPKLGEIGGESLQCISGMFLPSLLQ